MKNIEERKTRAMMSDATSVTAFISLGTCRPFSNVEYAKKLGSCTRSQQEEIE